MKQHTENLVKRLEFQFQEIETTYKDKLPMLLKKVEVANILVQELQTHVTRYKLITSEKEQIIYFKFCVPLIKKWAIAYEFIYQIEMNALFGTSEMKVAYYKQSIQKLNSSYKSKVKEFTFIRQNDKQFENITLISSNLNNDIIALFDAHFIAEKYLLNIISDLKEASNTNSFHNLKNQDSNYKWAKSKTDLVEICYALFYGNCVTDLSTQKSIQLTKLITVLELAFGSDLKDYKRLFSDIKKRRINDSFTSYLQKTIQHQIEIHFG
jgi:hypothetical protein